MSDHRPEDEQPREPLWGAARKPDEEPPTRDEPQRPSADDADEPWLTDPAGTRPRILDKETLVPRTTVRPALTAGAGAASASDSMFASRDAVAEPAASGGGMGDSGAVVVADDGREPPFAARFQFLLGALLAVGIIAVGLLAYGLTKSGAGDDLSSTWSPWRPSDRDISGAQEIADHVGPQYRLNTGEQLVLLVGGDLKIADLPTTIAMRNDSGDLSLVEGKGVLYKMCGLGPKCAIASGKPSTERHLLLRREALELALYSFRYLKGVDQVVVLLPPRLGSDPDQALFFRRGDVGPELKSQLRATLPAPAPTVSTVTRSKDAALVNRITNHGLFNFRYAQAQDTEVYLVLEPLGTAPAQTTTGTTGSTAPQQATQTQTQTTPSAPAKKKKGK